MPGETGLLVNEPGPAAFADAIAIANRLYAAKAFANGFELWQGDQQIVREEIHAS